MYKKFYLPEEKNDRSYLFLNKDGCQIGFFTFKKIEVDDVYVTFLDEKDRTVFYLKIDIFKHNLKATYRLKRNKLTNEWEDHFTSYYEINL